MPELPEVETTLRGIEPHVLGSSVAGIIIRESRMRWPIPMDMEEKLKNKKKNKKEKLE